MKQTGANELLRQKFLSRLDQLRSRLEHIAKDGRHAGGLSADFEEQAVERENDQVLGTLDATTQSEILQIESAVERIAGGRYGICEHCRKIIEPKRLEALPYAARCVACEGKSGR